jgi:hypothetical protein
MLDRQSLLERQKRLEALMNENKNDVAIFDAVARSIGPEIAERLGLVLSDYATLIEACLEHVELEQKRYCFVICDSSSSAKSPSGSAMNF